MTQRFKIDFQDSYGTYGLFYTRGWLWPTWYLIVSYKTKQEALDFYEKIKELPVYLP